MARAKQKPAERAAAGPPPAARDGTAPEPSAAELSAAARGLVDGFTRMGGLKAIDELLFGLRKHRQFADLVALGTTLAAQGIELSPRATRLTAQGLIEL